MNSVINIGRDLVVARRASGITQAELGRRLGVAQPQIARWEASEYRTASLERANAAASALGYSAGTSAALPLAAEEAVACRTSLPGAESEALTALARIGAPASALAAFARSHGVSRLEFFGSVLTDAFGPSSDVDVLATYDANRTPSLLDAADHEAELVGIFRRPVDLVSRAGVESSGNDIRKREILSTARTIYARP